MIFNAFALLKERFLFGDNDILIKDAIQIRVCVLTALARYAFSQVNEGICVNAFRAAAMYSVMTARMKQLLEPNNGGIATGFASTV
ncbi:MAG: hypothetical protein ABSA33_05720 [Candidatus Micrarchaeaceae archaeon]